MSNPAELDRIVAEKVMGYEKVEDGYRTPDGIARYFEPSYDSLDLVKLLLQMGKTGKRLVLIFDGNTKQWTCVWATATKEREATFPDLNRAVLEAAVRTVGEQQ